MSRGCCMCKPYCHSERAGDAGASDGGSTGSTADSSASDGGTESTSASDASASDESTSAADGSADSTSSECGAFEYDTDYFGGDIVPVNCEPAGWAAGGGAGWAAGGGRPLLEAQARMRACSRGEATPSPAA